MHDIPRLLAAARGEVPADLLLANGRVLNVFTGEIESIDVAIIDGRIAGLGRGYKATEVFDLRGSYLAPGLIDAHVHVESSLCTPAQFAAAIVPRGVTTAVVDPHEIANVAGPDGVRFISSASAGLPLDLQVMAPSCVPSTSMSTAGGTIDAKDIASLRKEGIARGLAEVMNYPATIGGDAVMLEKLAAMSGRPLDGHCPGVTGKDLNAYAAAGVGSDHESVTIEEAREKLARGLYLLIREATNARNLSALLPLVTPANSRRICFCTDDRTAGDLIRVGSVDDMVRRAIAFGIDPIEAIRMATLNPAEWFGLRNVGAIAPGRAANLFAFDDLRQPTAKFVFSRGKLIARDGAIVSDQASRFAPTRPPTLGRCEISWNDICLKIPARSKRIRAIGSRPDQLVTDHRVMDARVLEGHAVSNVSSDLLKMAVIERHGSTSNAGLGFIQGFGLHRGAIAGTVAHDHHNLVAIGCDDASMFTAARAAAANGGGLAVAVGENVIARLPLPIGGLMSDKSLSEVAAGYDCVVTAARELGSSLHDAFMAMSFMALEVIPSLKLTDKGLVDVERFQIVDLFV